MGSTLLVIALGSTIAVSGGSAVLAQTVAGSATEMPGRAPIGHLQPRVQQFSSNSAAELSAAELSVQETMSAFDIKQQKEDAELDKRLNICRGC
jgi:hypothetical protein